MLDKMKIFIVTLALVCVAAGSWPDIKSVSWQVEDKDKATVFKADMAIQWHVKYNKNVSAKVEVTDMYFEFTDKGQLSLVDHNDNYTEVQFIDKEKDQNLTLVFELDGDMYTLTKAELSFQILKDVFPDATNIGDFVVSTAKLALLQTGTKKSYACSTQTQFRLMSNETTKQDEMNIYVRFVPPSGKSLMLQAITFSKKDTYDPSSPCFTDKLPPAKMMGYKLLDSKKQICAMLDSVIDLKNVHYTAIDGTDMVTQVPIAMPVIPPSGSCQKNLTIIVIDLGKSNGISTGNLTLKYVIKVMKSEYYGDVQESVLDNITLAYNPMSPFFPNHGSMNKRETITADGLDGFQTPVANSYECDSMTEVNVTKDMTVTFNNTKMQAFNVDGGNYSDAFNCHTVPTTTAAETTAAETTAAKTTAAPTTPEPIFPDPILPMSSDRVVKDGNETCLHADIGLQIRLLYQQKSMSSGNLTEIFFNFDAANCTTSAKCVNSSTAVVTFERNGDYEQTLILTFTKDAKSMMTYLSDVSLQYTLNKHFPDAKGEGVQKYSQSGMYLSAPSTKSFGCNSTWTDVMMHSFDNSTVDTMGTVVRIVPIIVEAFPKSNKFAPEHKCYSDMPVPKPETGRWYINSTDNNSSVCASFEFASSINITYKLLVDGNHKTVTIPLDSVKHNVTESFGMCMQNKTTLMITMDNNKMNFTFEFKKKNISNDGKTFEYSMTGIAVIYSTDTKYLPNHEYVEGNIVPLSSMTLNLFSTDNDHSYKCTTNVSTALSGGAAISFSNVQVQPFNVKPNGQFSSADSCAADDMSPLIPIIVGSILAGLVVIVLVAYVIGRRRNSGANYETI